MADELHHPHDALVRAVLSDLSKARGFLKLHLPETLSESIDWSTLRLLENSFIDEALRDSEADLLYEVAHVSGEASIWLYLLLEHQSSPDGWMRLRLLKYCCRIWEMNLLERPRPSVLRPIVPLVFYQGERRWPYATEFASLFAESVRDWPWVPHFSHELIDQTGLNPEAVEGDVNVQLMQLLLLAAYHPGVPWMERVAELWIALSSQGPSGGINYVRLFALYLLSTQEASVVESFREVLRRREPGAGEDLMTYAQQLLTEGREEGRQEGREEGRQEGREEGRQETRVTMVENLLAEDIDWSVIERVTRLNESQFQALKLQFEH